MDDLVTVCESCHSLIHKMHGLGRGRISLERATEKVLKQFNPHKTPVTVIRAITKRAKQGSRKQRPGKGPGWVRDSDPTWIKSASPESADTARRRRRDGLA